jgi:hypothetical protein
MLTGVLEWNWTFAIASQMALNFLNDVHLDKVFLGAT